jgi:hypothetical protein
MAEANDLPGRDGLCAEQGAAGREDLTERGGRAPHGTKDQALPDVPRAVSERLGWRVHLPPLQVQVGMAERRSQIIAARKSRGIGSANRPHHKPRAISRAIDKPK